MTRRPAIALLGLIPLFVAVQRRRVRPLLLTGAGAALVLGAFVVLPIALVAGSASPLPMVGFLSLPKLAA